MCVTMPVVRSSASTRTPTSTEVLPAKLTLARSRTRLPTWTGWWKSMRSMAAVTMLVRQKRNAQAPAASSMSFMMTPPWMLPR